MKKATVLHNPGAGEGETSKQELISQIESAGFECSYSSTKSFRWENIETDKTDFLVLAGGDGTVRKIAEELLTRQVIEKNFPVGLLPMGTANNIAKTLGAKGKPGDIIAGWKEGRVKKFDVGTIEGLKKPDFFLESFGYGLFPKLMKEMKKQKKNDLDDPKDRLQAALKILLEIIEAGEAKKCVLRVEGNDYSGKFLLVEIMNIRSIGPNLNLAPDADPSDGEFDVVLITEDKRKVLAEYVRKKLEGTEVVFDFPVLKARKLEILWDGKHMHVDDEYYKLDSPMNVTVNVRKGLLEFLSPEGEIHG